MVRHPVDREGRVIPDASWPPGRAAPGRLELVRRFLNSTNRENGADHLGSVEQARRWLAADGWPARPTAAELVELRRFRTELHRAVVDLGAGRVPSWPAAIRDARLAVREVDGGLRLTGTGTGPARVVGGLVAILVESSEAGTLPRLRVCDHCGWTVYDRSRNGTGRWCSMGACGQRDKMRRYRARQRMLS